MPLFDAYLTGTNNFSKKKPNIQSRRTSEEFDTLSNGLDQFLKDIKTEDTFQIYLTNVLQQQLDALLDPKPVQYDIEASDRLSLFKYLHSIWK